MEQQEPAYALIRVNATEKTPSFEYIPRSGTFNVKGVSIPADPKEFYLPIIEWVDAFCNNNDINAYIMINVDLRYFSPASLLQLIKIFRKLEKFPNACINWFYEDDDLQEAGEELCDILKMHINLIRKEETED